MHTASNASSKGRAPAVHRSRCELRVLGTSVTMTEAIRKQAQADLGLRIRFISLDGSDVMRQGVLEPASYDIYDQWFHSIDCLWPAGALQPIDIRRITHWDEINALPKTGRLTSDAQLGSGCNPVHRLYVQPDGSLSSETSGYISMLPLTHNADSFVYLPEELHGLEGQEESWSWLVSPTFASHFALQGDPAIGALDAALALQASGEIQFADIGNLSIEEIDAMISLLIEKKKAGHFGGSWGSYAEAAQLMIDGRVSIQSNWSPAIVEYERAHLRYKLACPREGYRAWYGGLSISRNTSGYMLDAAYEYLNWWLSGWPGAAMARQGFYISNPERSRASMSVAEWDYWHEGKPATEALRGPARRRLIRVGDVRDGGSYTQRMSHIAVWNSVMGEHNYLVRRWCEFLRS